MAGFFILRTGGAAWCASHRGRDSAQEPTLAPGDSPGLHSEFLPVKQSCLAPIVENRRGSKVDPRELKTDYENPINPAQGTAIPYTWNATPRTLVCQKTDQPDQVCFTECDRWEFKCAISCFAGSASGGKPGALRMYEAVDFVH